MPFDNELMPARPQRDLRRHHLQHVVHDIQHVDRFSGQRPCQPVVQLALQCEQPGFVVAGLRQQLAQTVAQRDDQRVVTLQMALHVGQLLTLVKHALRQHVLARQQTLAHAPAECIVLDVRDALEHAGLLEFGLRIELQQRLGRHQAIVQLDLAARTRCCKTPRGTPTSCAARQTVTHCATASPAG